MRRNISRESLRHQILSAEDTLGDFKDLDVLMEYVLAEARKIMNADAGSIYEYDEKNNEIRILFAQNDTLQKKLKEGEKLPYVSFTMKATNSSISGYSALSKKIVNIEDVYNIPQYLDKEKKVPCPYHFDPSNDIKNGYHTQSMLTIPIQLKLYNKTVILQLINAIDENGNLVPFDEDDEYYITDFSSHIRKNIDHAHEIENMLHSMAYMAELRDPKETGSHVKRVSLFALEIYDRYASLKGIPSQEQLLFRDNLKLAAYCHDFGKIGVSDLILKKPGRFTEEDRNIMKGHTCFGAQIFTSQDSEFYRMAIDVCLHHHDRWDGGEKGYPGKYLSYMTLQPGESLPEMTSPLKGEEIPLSARIVALADVFDALMHERVYKEAWSASDTFKEIASQRGGQFDPEIVDAFMDIKERILAINKAIS